MKTALKIITIISALSAVFALSVNAIDVSLLDDSTEIYNQFFQYRDSKYNHTQSELFDYFNSKASFTDGEAQIGIPITFECGYFDSNDNWIRKNIIYSGIHLQWIVDEDTYNRPAIRVSYIYKQYLQNGIFMPMQTIAFDVIRFAYNDYRTKFHDETDTHMSTWRIKVFNSKSYNEDINIFLSSCMYQLKKIETETGEIYEDISDSTSQTDAYNYMVSQNTVITDINRNGLNVVLKLMSVPLNTAGNTINNVIIYNNGYNYTVIVTIIIYFGIGIFIYKLVSRIKS